VTLVPFWEVGILSSANTLSYAHDDSLPESLARSFNIASRELIGAAWMCTWLTVRMNCSGTRVSRRDIGSVVKATGVIKPMVGAEVRVGSSASGVVARLFVRIGDRVQKGQLLAELDSRELMARRDSAAAALRLSQANMSYTRADLQRKRDLSAARIIAPSELDLAHAGRDSAQESHAISHSS
jgi:multidrug efflux pump subunit AcrA (membrane-fusion protein)